MNLGREIIKPFNLILISSMAFNVAFADKPKKCPSVSDLKKIMVKLSDVFEKEPGTQKCCTANGFPYWEKGRWGVVEFIDSYGTENTWAVSLHDVSADNAEEALKSTNYGLLELRFAYGPANNFGHWYCSYYSSQGDVAVWLRN